MAIEQSGFDLRACFRAFLGGDNAAFAELYRELNPRLSAYCYKVSPAHCDDLMQELWERVIALRTKYSPTSEGGGGWGVVNSPAAFLFRMLRNLAIDHHRRTPSNEELGIRNEEFEERSNEPSDLETIVLEALEKLNDEDREVLVLNIYSGYKFGEIAEMLEISADAAWQRASRARARLRKIVMSDAASLGITVPGQTVSAKEIA